MATFTLELGTDLDELTAADGAGRAGFVRGHGFSSFLVVLVVHPAQCSDFRPVKLFSKSRLVRIWRAWWQLGVNRTIGVLGTPAEK